MSFKSLQSWITAYRTPGLHFFGANGAYAGVATKVLTTDSWRAFAAQHLAWIIVIALVLEVATIAVVLLINRTEKAAVAGSLFPDDPVEEVVLRFARQEDYANLMTVYRQWFPDEVSIDPAEYQLLLARGRFARLAEQVHAGGLRRPLGDYSVWPLSQATFDDLLEGRLTEQRITSKMVLDAGDPEARVLYVPEIYVAKNSELGPALLRDAKSFVVHTLRENPQLTSVAAWPYTEVGKSLCDRFFMTKRNTRAGKPTAYREASKDRLPALDAGNAKFHAVRHIRM